jgi:hypothetical protein
VAVSNTYATPTANTSDTTLVDATRRRPGWRRQRRCPTGAPSGHIPFTPRAKKCLEGALRESVARRDGYIGVEHLALALTAMTDGAVPRVLSQVGIPAAQARAEIVSRYRRAS